MDRFVTSKKRVAEVPIEREDTKQQSIMKSDSFKIVTMNSNSLANRISDASNHKEFKAFVEAHHPDVIAVQEVRLPAKTFSSNPKKGDGSRRDRTKVDDRDSKSATDKRLLQSSDAFKNYDKYYSLSDWRYAGSMVAIKKGNVPPLWIAFTFTNSEKESVMQQKLVTENGASSSLMQTATVEVITPLSTATETVRVEIKSTDAADAYESSSDMDGHSADGRLICLGYPSFDLLATYAPNNGSSETSFNRRRAWDRDIQLFFSRAARRGRPIVWVGDLNVAHTPADVTHPLFFSAQMLQSDAGDSGQAGEHAQPFTLAFKPKYHATSFAIVHQSLACCLTLWHFKYGPILDTSPVHFDHYLCLNIITYLTRYLGYTPNERRRFTDIIREGCLVDTYRHFNPVAPSSLVETIPSHPSSEGSTGIGICTSSLHLYLF